MNVVVRGNLVGICALIMWCTMVGLIRSITDAFGVAAGTALVYTVGSAAILLKNGIPKTRQMPRVYLYGVGAIFIAYEIVYSRALGMAENASQTLEVGMLNYLWPCLTVIFSIWINKIKLHWWVWPGTALSVAGLYWCVAASGDLEFGAFINNIYANPLPYVLGTSAGVSWALYSNLSFRYSKGFNAIPIFFTIIAVILWVVFFAQGEELRFPGYWPCFQLLLIGSVMGFSYSMWESGIHQGNFILLAVCSYFTPAGAMLFAALWLNTVPSSGFWGGVILVVGGSLICWLAQHKNTIKATPSKAGH